MIPLLDVIALLLFHWIADFVFQTDKMATEKSSKTTALIAHVSTYTVIMAGLTILYMLASGTFIMVWSLLLWLAVNFLAHVLTDYISSRATSYLWVKGDRHNFFVVIGFDQFAHYAVLLISWFVLIL